jgi:hypothetical protein
VTAENERCFIHENFVRRLAVNGQPREIAVAATETAFKNDQTARVIADTTTGALAVV